jgi:hypothetical protein
MARSIILLMAHLGSPQLGGRSTATPYWQHQRC